MFAACPSGKPEHSQRAASRQAASFRLRGFREAVSVRCPWCAPAAPHWHVCTAADDPVRLAVEAFAAQGERSAAVEGGMRHFGGR